MMICISVVPKHYYLLPFFFYVLFHMRRMGAL